MLIALKIGLVIAVIPTVAVVRHYYWEWKNFNKGYCKKCGEPLVFKESSRIYYYYQCPSCKYTTVVSAKWIRRKALTSVELLTRDSQYILFQRRKDY